jgi:DnaJ-class molecular chaperone
VFPNYYKILGLEPIASKEEIKKAYRKLALEFHPDRNKSPNAHEKFIEINEAYLILYDDEARQKYDIEFKLHFEVRQPENNQDFEYSQASEEQFYTESNSFEEESKFRDDNLNDWSSKAKSQGAEYARMAFEDFSKMVLGFVKETGFQLGNTLLVFFGLLLTMGGCGNLVVGFSTSGEIGNPILGLIMLPIGILLWWSANKNWDKH